MDLKSRHFFEISFTLNVLFLFFLGDFLHLFSSGWSVDIEKHFADSNPAYYFLALDFKDCSSTCTAELTVICISWITIATIEHSLFLAKYIFSNIIIKPRWFMLAPGNICRCCWQIAGKLSSMFSISSTHCFDGNSLCLDSLFNSMT